VEHDRVASALAVQLAYYRQAAADFDRHTHAALLNEVARRLQGRVDLSGDVLEMACGAGQWTAWLAESARSLTAVDAAPEMLEFARRRLTSRMAGQVELVCADIFDWRPRRRHQAAFFAFWLSHVPPARFAAFWELVAACLAPDGWAAFVDDGPGEAEFEVDLDADADLPTAGRQLPDGGWSRGWTPVRPGRRARDGSRLRQPASEHRVVKVLHDPEELARSLAGLGWAARVEPLGETFVVGWARPG